MTSLAAFPTVVKVWTIVRPHAISAHSLFQARRARKKICERVRDPISDNLKPREISKMPKQCELNKCTVFFQDVLNNCVYIFP